MLLGYVSDEYYVAIADAAVEVSDLVTGRVVASVRSSASGRIEADLPPGQYQVILAARGYGPKRTEIVADGSVTQFRLLSSTPYGFVWPKYAAAGDVATLCVSSPEPYRLSLWRYGGEREFVADLGFGEHEAGATAALLPDGDVSGSGVDWLPRGFPGQPITAPERSGLYFVQVDCVGGGSTNFPWVVSPRRPRAPLAVLVSDLTWNAYNNFGGRSNYLLPGGVPAQPLVNRRQDLARYRNPDAGDWECEDYPPLSFRRPEPDNAVPPAEVADGPTTTRAGSHLAATDWRLLCWLERAGHDYDLYAESQLDSGDLDLDAYRAVILGAHPEYWTWPMFDAVQSWVFERGGQLVYLGGNGLNCEVERQPGDMMKVHNGDTRRLGPPTTRDWSRFAARRVPEGGLLGVGYDARGLLTGAPFEVIDADHWAFTGSGVTNGDLFGFASQNVRIAGGASGHETDKLSVHAPPGTQVLARGRNADGGGAEITYFETARGGAVFSVGSVSFISSLLVDPVVSALADNVVRRFGSDRR
ncbi:N,N-dimethylformamidase beta subunit family domain-containing protein [Dactylosporangium sp. CA-233914]|uniref:N,N-dimethylformamidase beta subunit family domain-containing protein n=1 Tax=Dactylosporangium sp. CA-233914 TaxID=3239934 RepID=UPI003D93DED8